MRRMDEKLAKIATSNYEPRDFLIAFAKDADLSRGCSAPRPAPDGRPRTLREYRADLKRVIESDLADIVLTSLSTAEILADDGAYLRATATPAVRLNDPTDSWLVRGGDFAMEPSMPFRSARLDAVKPVANLGLYGMTFYNIAMHDHATLRAYSDFRDIAAKINIRHFLRISDPRTGFDVEADGEDYAAFRNDMLTRALAGIARRERPLFAQVGYFGPRAMEELADWDPGRLVVGITGCGEGTTRDCLERLVQAERYGARQASFSREWFDCEEPVLMLKAMRNVVRERMSSFEAVKQYHDELRKAGIAPNRALQDDAELTVPMLKANEARAA